MSVKQKFIWLLASVIFLFTAVSSYAEITVQNTVKGGVRAVDNGTLENGDGANEATVILNVKQLKLIKQARSLQGDMLTTDKPIAKGMRLYFVIILDNYFDTSLQDVQLLDSLNENQFNYIKDSLEMTTFTRNVDDKYESGKDDFFWKSGTWSKVTEMVDADTISMVDTNGDSLLDHLTVGRVPGQVNAQYDITEKTFFAIRFMVKVKARR